MNRCQHKIGPDKERDIRKPLDVTKEAMVSHHAQLLTLPQFAVLVAELLKARGEPTPMLYGWAGSILVLIKQRRKNVSSTSLTSRDANGMNNITTSKAMSTLLKRLRPPLTLRSSLWRDLQGLALVRDMRGSGETDPINRLAKGKGKGTYQRPIFQQAVECWKCG